MTSNPTSQPVNRALPARLTATLRQSKRQVMTARPVQKAAVALADRRGRDLALLFHRVGETSGTDCIVPTIPTAVFRRQVETLLELGTVVPASELAQDPSEKGVRFALTFDDDDPSTLRDVVPVLADLGVVGTFFLSGRSLSGLGGYWWEHLETVIDQVGVEEAAARLGAPTTAPDELAGFHENNRCDLGKVFPEVEAPAAGLSPTDITAMVDAGMEIGWHTLDHPALDALDDTALRDALTRGRRELEEHIGHACVVFAYPHGRTSPKVIAEVERGGLVAAYTTVSGTLTAADDRYVLNRWEPKFLDGDDFRAELANLLTAPERLRAERMRAARAA